MIRIRFIKDCLLGKFNEERIVLIGLGQQLVKRSYAVFQVWGVCAR
jgi:hypothetical protein